MKKFQSPVEPAVTVRPRRSLSTTSFPLVAETAPAADTARREGFSDGLSTGLGFGLKAAVAAFGLGLVVGAEAKKERAKDLARSQAETWAALKGDLVALDRAIAAAGSQTALAARLGMSPSAICKRRALLESAR